jgi:uncharacterized membrane protein YhhN
MKNILPGFSEFSGILNTRNRILSILYFFIGIFYIILPVIAVPIPPLYVKALIIPVLILIFQLTGNKKSTFHRLFFAALFFSWAGDIALGVPRNQETLFMPGLVCFLITHVLYFIVFIRTPGMNLPIKKFFYVVIPVILYGTALLIILFNDLGEMKIPVIVYTAVILAMLTTAINRREKVNRTSYYLVFIGAVLFVLSDSMIALDKFNHPFQFASPLIMFTYIAGQYLIVMGYLSETKNY